MSYFKNTNKILILLIAILLATNIATVFTIYSHNKEFHSFDEPNYNKWKENRNKEHANFMKAKLDLSEEQIQIFDKLRDQFHLESDKLRKKIRDKHKLLYAQLAKEEVDMDTLNLISDEIGDLYSDLKMLSIDHYMNLRESCTPIQKQKLYSMFRHLFEKDSELNRKKDNKKSRYRNKDRNR